MYSNENHNFENELLKAEIANNEYPVDYDKISDALMASLSDIV